MNSAMSPKVGTNGDITLAGHEGHEGHDSRSPPAADPYMILHGQRRAQPRSSSDTLIYRTERPAARVQHALRRAWTCGARGRVRHARG